MQDPERKHGGDRQSIWSITKREQALYFSLFSVFLFLGLVFLTYHEIFVIGTEENSTVIRNIVAQTGVTGAAAAALSLATIEGGRLAMLARYIEETYLNPWRKRRQEKDRKQGLKQGLEQGRAEVQARWGEWNKRRLAAATEGKPFNEPPPRHAQE